MTINSPFPNDTSIEQFLYIFSRTASAFTYFILKSASLNHKAKQTVPAGPTIKVESMTAIAWNALACVTARYWFLLNTRYAHRAQQRLMMIQSYCKKSNAPSWIFLTLPECTSHGRGMKTRPNDTDASLERIVMYIV